MNKKTFLIKNYVLATSVIYLDYSTEEEPNNRNSEKQTIINIPKAKAFNAIKNDGKSLR